MKGGSPSLSRSLTYPSSLQKLHKENAPPAFREENAAVYKQEQDTLTDTEEDGGRDDADDAAGSLGGEGAPVGGSLEEQQREVPLLQREPELQPSSASASPPELQQQAEI